MFLFCEMSELDKSSEATKPATDSEGCRQNVLGEPYGVGHVRFDERMGENIGEAMDLGSSGFI